MILTESQLFNCIVYIHNNPMKAHMVKHIDEYEYSSYNEYFKEKYLITSKSKELLFGSSKDYMKIYKEMHKKCNIEDIADVKGELNDSFEIIKLYSKKYNKDIKEIIENKKLFKGLLLDLRNLSGLSLRQMAEIFRINKDKINKIINSNP